MGSMHNCRAAAAGRGPGGGVSPKGQVVSMPVYVWVNFFKVHKRRAYVAKPLRGSKVARRASLNQPNGLPSGGKYLPTRVIASRRRRRSNLKFHKNNKNIREAFGEIVSAAIAASQ